MDRPVKTTNDLSEGILYTDEYQFTMAQVYFQSGLHEKRVVFDYFFRQYPDYGKHQAGYCIFAGLEPLVQWMKKCRFGDDEIESLSRQRGRSGKKLFEKPFLRWLHGKSTIDGLTMRAVSEGRVVHPDVSLITVEGPLALTQILESVLLNTINYQTLVATKSARIKETCGGNLLLEFGLRRAQGKGANAGTRAALIGGADFTSNTGVSQALGLPPKGTHAHSMVQIFMALGQNEYDAFQAYADFYPDDCVLLVDTIDTLNSGVPNAIKVFEHLRKKGHQPVGIRLDSGDLAYLSIQASKMLDQAGFRDVSIVLSNQLDELVIWQIITQIKAEAPQYDVDPDHLVQRLVYGVGTRLITSEGHPALDGVYKMVAIYHQGQIIPSFKISESVHKTINPSIKKVWRIYDQQNKAIADVMGLPHENPRSQAKIILHHPFEENKSRALNQEGISRIEVLLEDVITDGSVRNEWPSLEMMRQRRNLDLASLYDGVKRIILPHTYHVSLTDELWRLKQSLIQTMKKEKINHANTI